MRLSILDDYQGVALDMADWTPVRSRGVEIAVERHPFADEDAVVRALADSELVAAMRERTPFPKSVVDRLPKLKLLITTGMRNASFDMAALKDRGVTVCGTGGPGGGNEDTAELAWGLILGAARRIAEDHQFMRQGGWQTRIGHRVAGKTLGLVGPRAARQRGRPRRPRLRHEGDRLEPESDRREGQRARRRAGRKGRAVPPLRHSLGASCAEPAQPRPCRRPRDRADETIGDPRQHLARADLRHRRDYRRAEGRPPRLCRVRRLRQGAAADRPSAAHRAERDPDAAYRLRNRRELPQLLPADRRERRRLSRRQARSG